MFCADRALHLSPITYTRSNVGLKLGSSERQGPYRTVCLHHGTSPQSFVSSKFGSTDLRPNHLHIRARPGALTRSRTIRINAIQERWQQDLAEAKEPAKRDTFLSRLLKPLRDFGIGRTSFWEGGVGLFIFGGIGVCLLLLTWIRGGQFGSKGRGYKCVLEFPLACGIGVGTPVRIRGVPIGSVVRVDPSLERVEVLADIRDATTVIPRNSLIEANQSGLIAEPLIDITPQLPIPTYTASPLDAACETEGKVVCHQGHIKGQPGVAMDDLVYIMTKMARNMEAQGLDKMFDAAEAATAAIEEARPLIHRVTDLVEEITPLLSELREGNMMADLESLVRSASEAAADLQKLQTEVLTEENVKALRDSVLTLTKTLNHIESISGDVGGVVGDNKVKSNVKQLIEALSRIVSD